PARRLLRCSFVLRSAHHEAVQAGCHLPADHDRSGNDRAVCRPGRGAGQQRAGARGARGGDRGALAGGHDLARSAHRQRVLKAQAVGTRWETVLVTESEQKADLQRYLKNAREAMVWKLDGLSEYDARRPLTPTGTNLLGLVKHLALVEMGY